MAELRWILLGLGLLLILGVWLWGRRGSAVAADDTAALVRGDRHPDADALDADHGSDEDDHPGDDAGHHGALVPEDLPTVEVPVRGYDERRSHGANPPVVTLDDLPEDVEDVVLVDPAETATMRALDPEAYPETEFESESEPEADFEPDAEATEAIEAMQTAARHVPPPPPPPTPVRRIEPRMPEPDAEPDFEPEAELGDMTPTQAIRTAPLPVLEPIEPRQVLGDAELHDEPPTQSFEVPTLSPEVAVPGERRRPPRPERLPEAPLPPAPLVVSDPLADTMVERQKRKGPAETVPRQQRIVAVRLIAKGDQRIDGATLKVALTAERLTFGRYSIFHRLLESDRPIYSVASLVEPGSFDPDVMGSEQYPGISLFAVFPGPLPAPQAFDELLATARRLADKLGGVLQDDSGSSLTGQRVLSLREELVHFEHIVGLGARGRPAG